MRFITSACLALLAATGAVAQSLAPSPTESIGCEPHGDHWHCDGPASTAGPVSAAPSGSATATATTASEQHDDDHDHDHDHASGTTGSLKPSPTESIGCKAHGDHWHCDGPASAASAPTGSSQTSSSAKPAATASTTAATAAGAASPGIGGGGGVVAIAILAAWAL